MDSKSSGAKPISRSPPQGAPLEMGSIGIPLSDIPESGKRRELHGRRGGKAKPWGLHPCAPVAREGGGESTAGEASELLLWAGNVHQTFAS